MSRTRPAFSSCKLSVLAAVAPRAGLLLPMLVATTSHAAFPAFVNTRLDSLGVTATMAWQSSVTMSYSNTITDSQSVRDRTLQMTPSNSTSYNRDLRVSTMGSPNGIDETLIVKYQSFSPGWLSVNSQVSATVTFGATTTFRNGNSTTGSAWSYAGSALANGTVFAPGTYTLNWSYSRNSTSLNYAWEAIALFSTVPTPGAAALLGAAGLLGRRRRA